MHNLTIKINVPIDFDSSDTLQYTSMTISDSTIDVPMANSNGRVDIMLKNVTFDGIVLFFGMISTLPLELLIGTSMMLSEIVMLVYYKVSEPSKPVGTCILPVKLCKYCVNRGRVLVSNFGTKRTT